MSQRRKEVPPVNVKGSISQLAAIQGHKITPEEVNVFMESDFNILVITGDNDLVSN